MGFTYSLTAAPPYSSGDDTDGVAARMLLNYGMADFLMLPASEPGNQLDTRIYQTVPYHNSYYSGLVLKTKKPYSTFRFLDPFTGSMYLTMASRPGVESMRSVAASRTECTQQSGVKALGTIFSIVSARLNSSAAPIRA